MSFTPARPLTAAATVAAALLLSGAPASAQPACEDAVGSALHEVHEATGDPAGLVHEVEETYCSAG